VGRSTSSSPTTATSTSMPSRRPKSLAYPPGMRTAKLLPHLPIGICMTTGPLCLYNVYPKTAVVSRPPPVAGSPIIDATGGAARAGKHVLCGRPRCITLLEAAQMLAACSSADVQLMYAEDLCFAPRYVRAKQLADEGACGKVYLGQQSAKRFGPHSDWLWDVG